MRDHPFWNQSFPFPKPALTIVSVCRKWRDIGLSLPVLWSIISFIDYPLANRFQTSKEVARVRQFLERSGREKLFVIAARKGNPSSSLVDGILWTQIFIPNPIAELYLFANATEDGTGELCRFPSAPSVTLIDQQFSTSISIPRSLLSQTHRFRCENTTPRVIGSPFAAMLEIESTYSPASFDLGTILSSYPNLRRLNVRFGS